MTTRGSAPISPWNPLAPLVLASTSTTRRQLLNDAGFAVECEGSGVDERALESQTNGLPPTELALALAKAKALAVAKRRPDRIVIGADQILSCEGEIFHKPQGLTDAERQIGRLSGRTHRLHSAVAVADGGVIVEGFVEEARLTMRELDRGAIRRYVEAAGAHRVTASVGGYQLEGLGIHLFARIEGDHSTILGLPLLPLLGRLRARGCLAF
ncbi:MAG: Maf family nucleotide pyrophosphatase [Methylobacterium sp.]|uniref:Maf family protein n=1 Tax=Methylobacterium sp. TaxID=409 RepID=UPI0025D9F871|nr:Maf family nucleotide pyrophosphatase [Methylobacterium sp.]MBX9933848.1 Maf family nucleotide pyrophosphatase [Methylobacterium sp.]